MPIEPSTAAPTKPPGQTGGRAAPEGVSRVLFLLRWIIGYGRNLADNFHQHAAGAAFRDFAAIRFHTPDLDAVFARIRRGLMLALALEAKLLKRAATGRELVEAPVRSGTPAARRPGTARKPRAARRTNLIDLPLDRLPTAQQIAEELRRRPLGAILVDICRDLGITQDEMRGAQWQELVQTIIRYGGNMVVLCFKDMKTRLRQRFAEELGGAKTTPVNRRAARQSAASPTGPPPLAQAA